MRAQPYTHSSYFFYTDVPCNCVRMVGVSDLSTLNPQPEVHKKNLSGHRVQSKKNLLDLQVTLKIDLKVMMVKVILNSENFYDL